MALNRKTAVIGSAIFAPVTRQDRALEEILYELAQAALKDAGLTIDDIDGIVVASNDQFDGRAISIMAASGSVGGVDRDILSTPSAGEHAFVMGVLRIASGQYDTHLIVSWSPTEASSLSEAQRLGADPYFHRALPLDELSSNALQAAALAVAAPQAHQLAPRIAARNRANGAHAYPDAAKAPAGEAEIASSEAIRWPVRKGMVSEPITGAVALVIASEDFVDKHGIENPAWVRGMGWATEAGFLGDRELSKAPALEEAARRAYEEAGISDPRQSLDLVELTDVTPYQELLSYEALGLSKPEAWEADLGSGIFDRTGKVPINPSGGIVTLNPVFCTGLIRIAEAAGQVRGKAGRHQIKGARTALAHAASGFAMMYQTVLVLGAEREGVQA
ncbi:thiolase C-terminal domain-containing protein [Propylenella binzhouense]|uniref:Thiolase C-terminal domain-containing protein n=1 Tax=Propylenella binzhouense TaxID=2555902 RepID=A0A964WSE7_9HYPH|nr:hypothetical protein [Propylenella binzhouense]MYZ46894.1 hypothetical protein [Propylenella binzhouense]